MIHLGHCRPTNTQTLTDIFSLCEDLRNMPLKENHILVSFLLSNVLRNETIDIIIRSKAFTNNWSNEHKLNITETNLIQLQKTFSFFLIEWQTLFTY